MPENDWFERSRQLAVKKREATYTLGVNASKDHLLVSRFLLTAQDLEIFWSKFVAENFAVLDAMVELGTVEKFSNSLEIEAHSLVISTKVLVKQVRSSSDANSVVLQDTNVAVQQEVEFQNIDCGVKIGTYLLFWYVVYPYW